MLPIQEFNKLINFLNLDPRIKDKFERIHTTIYQGMLEMKNMIPEADPKVWSLLVDQYLLFATMFVNNAGDCRNDHVKELEQKQLTKDVTNQFAEIKDLPEWKMKYGGGKYQLTWHDRPFFRPLNAQDMALLIPNAIKQMEGADPPVVEVTTTPAPEPEVTPDPNEDTVEIEVTTTQDPSMISLPSIEVTTTIDPGDQNPPVNPVAEAAKAQLENQVTTQDPNSPPAP